MRRDCPMKATLEGTVGDVMKTGTRRRRRMVDSIEIGTGLKTVRGWHRTGWHGGLSSQNLPGKCETTVT